MTSDSSPKARGNLLLTLPPELRNVIYAMVITTDFYELDPTISARTFPRPRYGMFHIERGIKAQGGTPSIAKTCQQIRAEALDVYYGRNTFALVGDDNTTARRTYAIANRVAAHEWMQLIGDDAKYLRRVRFLLVLDRQQTMINFLVTIASNSNGDAPTVTALPSPRRLVNVGFGSFARQLEAMLGKHLAETGDLGKVWQAVIERALYSSRYAPGVFDFNISDEAIEEAAANATRRKSKPQAPPPERTQANISEVSDKNSMARAISLKRCYDSDCMEVEAPANKAEARKVASAAARNHPFESRDDNSDFIELAALDKTPKVRKRATNTMSVDQNVPMVSLPGQIAYILEPASKAMPRGQSGCPVFLDIEVPTTKPKPGKKPRSRTQPEAIKDVSKDESTTEAVDVDAGTKPATRASTRKSVPRKL